MPISSPLSSRRLFFAQATVGLASIAALSLDQFAKSKAAAPGSLGTNMAFDFGRLDTVYTAQGIPGIESMFRNLDRHQLTIAFEWIFERKHVALLGLVVERLSDPRKMVRYASYGLLQRLGKSVARPLVPQIAAELENIKSRDFKELVRELLRTIEQ